MIKWCAGAVARGRQKRTKRQSGGGGEKCDARRGGEREERKKPRKAAAYFAQRPFSPDAQARARRRSEGQRRRRARKRGAGQARWGGGTVAGRGEGPRKRKEWRKNQNGELFGAVKACGSFGSLQQPQSRGLTVCPTDRQTNKAPKEKKNRCARRCPQRKCTPSSQYESAGRNF